MSLGTHGQLHTSMSAVTAPVVSAVIDICPGYYVCTKNSTEVTLCENMVLGNLTSGDELLGIQMKRSMRHVFHPP